MNPNDAIEEKFDDIDHVPLNVLDHMSAYWKTIAERRKRQHDVSIKRIVIGQLVTIIVVGVSSILIERRLEAVLLFGSTLLLYPALTDLLMSSGSVLSASIHHDLDRQDESSFRFSLIAFSKSVFSTTTASLIVGSVAGAIGYFALGVVFFDTLKLAVLATFLSASIGLPMVMSVTFIVRNIKSNPDDIIPAFESSMFNVIMLFSIVIASRLVL